MAIRDMDTAAAVIGIPVARRQARAPSSSAPSIAALPARSGPLPISARSTRAASISTAPSRSCSSSSSAAWAASSATSSAPPSSCSCRSCSTIVAGSLFGGAIDAGQLENFQKVLFGGLIIWFLIKEPKGLAALLARLRRKLIALAARLTSQPEATPSLNQRKEMTMSLPASSQRLRTVTAAAIGLITSRGPHRADRRIGEASSIIPLATFRVGAYASSGIPVWAGLIDYAPLHQRGRGRHQRRQAVLGRVRDRMGSREGRRVL